MLRLYRWSKHPIWEQVTTARCSQAVRGQHRDTAIDWATMRGAALAFVIAALLIEGEAAQATDPTALLRVGCALLEADRCPLPLRKRSKRLGRFSHYFCALWLPAGGGAAATPAPWAAPVPAPFPAPDADGGMRVAAQAVTQCSSTASAFNEPSLTIKTLRLAAGEKYTLLTELEHKWNWLRFGVLSQVRGKHDCRSPPAPRRQAHDQRPAAVVHSRAIPLLPCGYMCPPVSSCHSTMHAPLFHLTHPHPNPTHLAPRPVPRTTMTGLRWTHSTLWCGCATTADSHGESTRSFPPARPPVMTAAACASPLALTRAQSRWR